MACEFLSRREDENGGESTEGMFHHLATLARLPKVATEMALHVLAYTISPAS